MRIISNYEIQQIKKENDQKIFLYFSKRACRRCGDCQNKYLSKITQLVLFACLITLAKVFFNTSLKGCPSNLTQVECIRWFNQQAKYIGAFLISSGLCYSFLIISVLLRVVSVWYTFIFGFVILYQYKVSDRANFWDHSEYNFQILAVMLPPLVLILLYLIGWLYFGKKKQKLALTFFVVLHVLFPVIVYYSYVYKSCEGEWKLGLKDSLMLNGEEVPYCLFDEPVDCWCKVLDGVSNLSWVRSCSTQYGSLRQNKQYYGDCEYVGIPNYKHLLTEQDL